MIRQLGALPSCNAGAWRASGYKGAASEKTSDKYLLYYSAMEAYEDSLLSPITEAADH
jgi:hypothetical protein